MKVPATTAPRAAAMARSLRRLPVPRRSPSAAGNGTHDRARPNLPPRPRLSARHAVACRGGARWWHMLASFAPLALWVAGPRSPTSAGCRRHHDRRPQDAAAVALLALHDGANDRSGSSFRSALSGSRPAGRVQDASHAAGLLPPQTGWLAGDRARRAADRAHPALSRSCSIAWRGSSSSADRQMAARRPQVATVVGRGDRGRRAGAALGRDHLSGLSAVGAGARPGSGFWPAAVISSLLWTLLHWGYSWPGLASVFLAGMGLSWIMRRTAPCAPWSSPTASSTRFH